MTGEVPFDPEDTDEQPVAPDHVHEDDKEDWEAMEGIIRLQHKWVLDLPSVVVPCLLLPLCTVWHLMLPS